MKHKVKTHNWVGGILRAREFIFESFDDAIRFVQGSSNHSVKIFDEEGRVVHEAVNHSAVNTYA